MTAADICRDRPLLLRFSRDDDSPPRGATPSSRRDLGATQGQGIQGPGGSTSTGSDSQTERSDSALPMRYQLLAIRAYEEGNLTEGELSRLLRSDRVSARRTVQRMTHTQYIVEGGEVESLPIDLAARLAGQGA